SHNSNYDQRNNKYCIPRFLLVHTLSPFQSGKGRRFPPLPSLYTEYRLLCNVRSKALKSHFCPVITKLPLFFLRCARVSQRIWDRDGRNNPVGSNSLCYWDQITHLNDRETSPFDFF